MAPLQDTIITNPDSKHIVGTPMQQFYSKKSVFMTGATGFLGKVIIEKLLRTCDIDNIYILIRHKKNDDIHTRFGKICDDALFDKVRHDNPKFRHKIIAINGDCVLPGLGINASERAMLIKNVDIVFHVAATVRFDEKLKLALGINVCGTREIMNLAREMENLKAFVHVSTAYANCNNMHIAEKFYKVSLSGENALKLAETLDEQSLEKMTPELLQDWPNTYTFTKCLAEDLIKTNAKGLPIAIFRPAIVIPTCKEPVPGWIDNMYGPTGIIVGVAAGLLRVLYIAPENTAELVPVDYCVNSMLACCYDVAQNSYAEPPIYNFVTSPKNKLTWKKYVDYATAYGEKTPLMKCAWYYSFTMSSSKLLVTFLSFFYHILPAALVDLGLFVCGKKPKLLDTYGKIHKLCSVLSYFSNRTWSFENTNVMNLWHKLSDKDKDLFEFNMESLDWAMNIKTNMMGIRTYLMKEDPNNIEEARIRYRKLKYLHYITVNIFRVGILYLLYNLLSKFLLPASQSAM